MITSANQIPLRPNTMEMSFAGCSRCDEDTANVCAKCGVLKCPDLEHVGRLPAGVHDVITGRNPSWRTLRIVGLLALIGGLCMGLGWSEFVGG